MTDPTRPVPTYVDAKGGIYANSICSPKNNKVRALVCAPAPNVIPIIFVPGIMGSNLIAKRDVSYKNKKGKLEELAKRGKKVWNVDSNASALAWFGDDAAKRQVLLNKDVVEVDRGGKIVLSQEEKQTINRAVMGGDTYVAKRGSEMVAAYVAANADKRRRGWGTVSWGSYGEFMTALESDLNGLKLDGEDKVPNAALAALIQQIAGKRPPGALGAAPPVDQAGLYRLLKFRFPVHAYGYNWLQSNLDSGKDLASFIATTIQDYNDPKKSPGTRCQQVMVITHSMGGLVARAAALEHGAADQMLAVIHGVMPTHGAAAFYKRFVAGFHDEGSGLLGSATAWAAAQALGANGQKTTPVLGYGPGPMELAPNHLYNGGKPWLFIKDKQGRTLKALPEKGDPYAEIYRDHKSWWRAINPEWLNPAKLPVKSSLGLHGDALDIAESYHRKLGGRFHPHTYAYYGVDPGHPTWGTCTWEVVAHTLYVPPGYGSSDSSARPSVEFPHRRADPQQALTGAPETWRIEHDTGYSDRRLRDGAGRQVQARVLPPADPGDGTVPGLHSAAGVDSGCRVACRINGYDHQGSYNHLDARAAVLDAVVRAAAEAKVPA